MCDFHDFGHTFFSVFALLKMSKNVFWVVARLPQILKSTFFEILFFTPGPLRRSSTRKFFKKHRFKPLREAVHCPANFF